MVIKVKRNLVTRMQFLKRMMLASEDFEPQKEPTHFTNIWLVSKQCGAYRGLLNVVMSVERESEWEIDGNRQRVE